MDYLYAPWRTAYKKNEHSECNFCNQLASDRDKEYLILKRFNTCSVFLNKFPYTKGHILVIPHTHTMHLSKLAEEELNELFLVTSKCMTLLHELLHADGINMGMNVGKTSGGSIPHHLHIHVIPRFIGDTNFLTVCDNTKVITFDIHSHYQELLFLFSTFSW